MVCLESQVNKFLTKGCERVLRESLAGEDLVRESGAGWWIGDRKTSGPVAMRLLRLCLISPDAFNGIDVEHYHVNEDGKKCLESDEYIPTILRIKAIPGGLFSK
jgi:hypothetical protein